MHKPLYIYRPVLNAQEIINWYKNQGFKEITTPEQLHVTIVFSKASVDWSALTSNVKGICVPAEERSRSVEPLGDKGAIVMKFASTALQERWKATQKAGCSWDYESYQPHITITYSKPDFDVSDIQPFAGDIILGPEIMEDMKENWRLVEKAYIIQIPAFVKAHSDSFGRRILTVQASSQDRDLEGDVILQKALLDSAQSFLANPHGIDIDHISEIGARLGVPNPENYVIGKGLEVIDLGQGNTGVKAEIFKGPEHQEAEKFWASLHTSPPTQWRASIYGLPLQGNEGLVDARHSSNREECHGATRFCVKAMRWKSLALTTSPMNDSLTGYAQIVEKSAFMKSAAAWAHLKSYSGTDSSPFSLPASAQQLLTGEHMPQDNGPGGNIAPNGFQMPRNRIEMMGHHTHHLAIGKCAAAGKMANSVAGFREHFMKCCGADYHTADIHALSLMHLLKHR